jgi:putative membrane protein insertion efficiency factor
MGHGHTSEEFCSARGVCGADGGVVAAAAGTVVGARETVDISDLTMEGSRFRKRPLEMKEHTQSTLRVRMALFALRVYKSYFSVLFAGACRFEPSCSCYAQEAIARFGVVRGSWLGLKRLLRCQPLSRKFGSDPVPQTWGNMHSRTALLVTAERTSFLAPAKRATQPASAPEANDGHEVRL